MAELETDDAPWPQGKPKEIGFKFRGYRLTDDRRPTFLYEYKGVRVEDFPNPLEKVNSATLVRKLTFTTGGDRKNLWFRVATGSPRSLGDG